MISNISRRKIRKLLRENSSESSLSKSMSNAPENLTELSIERVRGAFGKADKRNDLSMKNLQALFKVYQMESNKLIDFAGFFSFTDHQTSKYLNTFSSLLHSNPETIQQKWHHLLSLKFPSNFDSDCIALISLIHNILHHQIVEPIPCLLLLNYLVILTFWQDYGSLSMDKSNLLMDHLKGIIKAFIKIVKQNKQDLYNSNYLQLVENVGSELYPFLLRLFQIIKKKSNYYYCFISLSELIDKLTKKNLLRSLGLNTLNQLELSLNKKQKLIFEEIFLRQADPVVDRNLIFKSVILKPYKEDLFSAFLAFEYRNNINFTKLLYFFDSVCEICQKIEAENPKTFEKSLEFKMLIKTLTEMFEYFCSKLSNLNTEFLLLLDEELEQIAYLAKYLSRKRRQELSNAYIKVNGYFDKTPSDDVIQILDTMEQPSKRTKQQDSKKKKKGNNDFSNKILVSLKIIKKIDSLQKRVHEMIELFDMIHKGQDQEYILSTKAKLKTGKAVLKVMDMVGSLKEIDHSFRKEFEVFLISFLQVPSLNHKAFLKKLKQRYELFIQDHKVQGRAEVFKLITQNLQQIFASDESAKQLQNLAVNRANIGMNKAMELKERYEEDEDEDEEDDDDEEEEEEDDDEDEEDADGEMDSSEKFSAYKETIRKQEFSMKEKKVVSIIENKEKQQMNTKPAGKKAVNDNVQGIRIMLEDHFGEILLNKPVIIDKNDVKKYVMNVDSLFHETSNHIMNSLVNMSNEEIEELLEMLNNIIRNFALNWVLDFTDTNESTHAIKGLLQNYRKFLKCAGIFSRFSYNILLDGSNNIIGHSFLPIVLDSKNEIIEYEAQLIKHPTTGEGYYDIEYFFRLQEYGVEGKLDYIDNFGEINNGNKSKVAVFTKLKEEAKNNPSFRIYGYQDALVKENAPRHLVVSFETEDDIRKFVILPSSLNTVPV